MCCSVLVCGRVSLRVYRRTSREEGKEEEKEKGACVVVVAAVPSERVCMVIIQAYSTSVRERPKEKKRKSRG